MRAATAAALTCLFAHPAWALCDYQPNDPKSCVQQSKADPHMVTANYDPSQVYAFHIPQGQAAVVTLGAGETALEGFGGDSTILRVDPSGNAMVFITGEPVVAQRPIFIRSRLADGLTMRTYSLLVDSVPTNRAEFGFTFNYPAEEAAKRAVIWRQARAEREQKDLAAQLAASQGPNDTNFKYVLQGERLEDWNLLPTRQVSDNGSETHFSFPGNMRVPIIYAVNPDGKEAIADVTFDSRTGIATVHQLARAFHLRDGDALLCVFNKAFDPVGVRSATGTISPDIERVAR